MTNPPNIGMRLLGASAVAALLAGLPASARADQGDDAVARVRRHVRELSQARAAAGTAPLPWWQTPVPSPGAGFLKVQEMLPTRDIPVTPQPPQPPQSPQANSQADPPPTSDPGGQPAPVQQDKPGVLTRKGVLVFEPSVQFQHTNLNNFVAGGVAILDTVLVGSIQASQANRDAITATAGFRYGATDRLEVEARVPYVYRSDSTTNTLVSTNTPQSTTDLHDSGLGDIEGAIHYQVNDGNAGWPIFVANLRVKSNTGKGPFDVARDANGVETQLATGSGFWGIEPSVTLVAPSDPAVFYVNAGYLYNVPENIGETIGTRYLRSVEPGNAIRMGMGMGIALNEKVSFSLGYQHDFISASKFKFNDGDFNSATLSVGTLNIGVNWQIDDTTALNINVGVGVTRDAPDVSLMARMPISFKLFE